MPTVVISPFNVLNFPEGGGHFWVYMQYAQGLRESGCDVYWLEAFRRRDSKAEEDGLLAPFLERMARFGFGGKLILYAGREPGNAAGLPEEYVGRSRAEAEAIFERADLLLNFHYAIAPPLLARFKRAA